VAFAAVVLSFFLPSHRKKAEPESETAATAIASPVER
jgi:hypothetical protein